MKIVTLDIPPDPQNGRFRANPLEFQRATATWMNSTKQKIESASRQNDTPVSQPFVVSSYTTNTALTGTSTLGDVANFVCTLIAAMIKKGIITDKDLQNN